MTSFGFLVFLLASAAVLAQQEQPQPSQPLPTPEQPPRLDPSNTTIASNASVSSNTTGTTREATNDTQHSIKEFTRRLFDGLKSQDLKSIANLVADTSILHFSSVLPFGGTYKGPLGMATALDRMGRFMEVGNWDYSILIDDPISGVSITNLHIAAVYRGRQQINKTMIPSRPGQLSRLLNAIINQPSTPEKPGVHPVPVQSQIVVNIQAVIDWYVNGTIRHIAMIPLNDVQVFEQTRTSAQVVLHELITTLVKEDYNSLNKLVADNACLKLINFGSALMFPKTVFNGVNEIKDGLKSLKENMDDAHCEDSAEENVCGGTLKLLHADEANVISLFLLGGQTIDSPKFVIGNFTCSQEGKIVNAEITASRPLYPWQFKMKSKK